MNVTNQANHTEKAFRGLRHIASARVLSQLITWTLTLVTIHVLQPRDYGLIATAGIVTVFAQLLLDGGLREVLISHRLLSEQIAGAAVTAALTISSALGAIIFLAAPWVSAFFRSPPLRAILEVGAFNLPIISLAAVPSALLSKQMRFERIAAVTTVTSIVQGVATLGLALAGLRYWALVIGPFIATAVNAILFWSLVDAKPIPSLHLRVLAPLVRNSSRMLGQRLTFYGIDNFDIFLLSRYGGATVLGPYSVARNLAHSVLTQISRIMNQVLVPAFAAETVTQEQLRRLSSLTSVASVILFPLFWTIGVASQLAFPLVFGARWGNLIVPFLAFSAIVPLRGLYALLNAAVVGTGRIKTTFHNTLMWAVIILPLMLLGLRWGADGVALSWTMGFPLVLYFALRRIAAAFSTPLSTLIRPMLRPAVCAATSAAVAEVLLWALSDRVPASAILTGQCAMAALTYWIMVRAFARPQYSLALVTMRRVFAS